MSKFGYLLGVPAVCVLCRRRAVDAVWRPFCSERCKLADLARWADERYRIPGEAAPGNDDREEEDGGEPP